MVKHKVPQPAEWIAWMAAGIGWLCSVLIWASGSPEQRLLSIVATVLVAASVITITIIAILRRSSALGVLAFITLLAPLLVLLASFATW